MADTRARRSSYLWGRISAAGQSGRHLFGGYGSRRPRIAFSNSICQLEPFLLLLLEPLSNHLAGFSFGIKASRDFSEKRSKDREHLFLDMQAILHSYTCHRGNKSNICIIRWKLRVRKAGRWGLETSHLSCAVSLYQLILDTWTVLCNLILSAVDAGYYQHLSWYQHESIAGLQILLFGRLFGFVHPFGSVPGRPRALLKVWNETTVCGFYGRQFDSCKSQRRRATGGRAQLIKSATLQSLGSVWNAVFCAAVCFKLTKCTQRI